MNERKGNKDNKTKQLLRFVIIIVTMKVGIANYLAKSMNKSGKIYAVI